MNRQLLGPEESPAGVDGGQSGRADSAGYVPGNRVDGYVLAAEPVRRARIQQEAAAGIRFGVGRVQKATNTGTGGGEVAGSRHGAA